MNPIQKLTEDLAVIQKLGDSPNSDNNLTADELKAKFDYAALAIQKYLNSVVDTLNSIFGDEQTAYLLKSGGAMSGPINMNGQPITGLNDPVGETDAARKGYVDKRVPLDGSKAMEGDLPMGGNRITGLGAPEDTGDAVPKSYADDIKKTTEAALPKAGGTMTGAIAMGGNKITGLGTPSNDGDAVPKSYAVARKELASMSHSQLDANGSISLATISSYPTAPGVYRVGVSTNLPVPGSWGNLIIYNIGYVTHIFENGDGFWVQRTENTYTVTQDGWRRLPAMKTTTATILASNWSGNNAWAEATGVKTTSTVIVSPAYGNRDNYINYGLMCISQPTDGFLAFGCDTVPSMDITVNVLILD